MPLSLPTSASFTPRVRLWLVLVLVSIGAPCGPPVARAQEEEAAEEEPAEPAGDEKEESEKADGGSDYPLPKFKTPVAEEKFTAGHQLFEEGKYSEALKILKPLTGAAAGADDKTALQAWISGCEGGMHLEGYERTAQSGKLRQTFFLALDTVERYRNSPIGPRFETFVEELRPKVLEVLDSFDRPSARFSKKFGKSFVKDKAIVYRGANCLLWTSLKDGKTSQLKFSDNIPQKWTGYHSLLFWVRAERPAEIKVLVSSPTAAGKDRDPSVLERDYSPSVKSGWSRVELDLAQFKKHGNATLATVDALIFQIDSQSTYKIYFDEICLVRKDGGAAAADEADSEKKKDKKDDAKKKAKKTPKKAQTKSAKKAAPPEPTEPSDEE